MKTITVKIHEALDEKLTLTASAEGISKGELLRRSMDFYFASNPAPAKSKKRPTLHDRLKKYIPKKGTGIRDLASNPKYMESYGRD
jgi:hypothetical protein